MVASLLPMSAKQLRSIAEADRRINLWHGAVRSGKTVASLLAWLCAIAEEPPGLVLCLGSSLATIERNVIEPLQDPTVFGAVAAHVHHTRNTTTARILGRTVHLIGAADASAEGRIRGLTCGLAYVDEATLIPEAVWTQLLGRLSVPGARLFATTNPDGPGHWLKKRYLDRRAELDFASWHFTLDDNPGLDPSYVSSLKREYTGLFYKRWILGEWRLAEGSVYDMWDPDRHVTEAIPAITRHLSLGVDYGTANPTSAILAGLGVDGRVYFLDEWRWDSRKQGRSLTDVEHSQRIRAWLADEDHPGGGPVEPEWIVVDPSAKSFIVQLFTDGLSPMPANNAVLDGIRTVSSLLGSGRLKVHPRCTGWIDEIGGYVWDDKAAALGIDKPIKAEDHSMDAGRYGLHTTYGLWRDDLTDEYEEAA